jgi:ATP-dependent Clp protease ATP-binding subunit ClpB
MDAGNMLKPLLARGELHMIGATTLDEYRTHIEKDAALERRFQPVIVDEPTVEDALSILRGLRERFEVFHGVKIHDGALVAAVTLSHRYISTASSRQGHRPRRRGLRDVAHGDRLDARGARRADPRVTRMEIEEAALAQEDDPISKGRLEELRRELVDARAEADSMRARWEAERSALREVQALRQDLERVRQESERAEREYDLNRALLSDTGSCPSSSASSRRQRRVLRASRVSAGCCAKWSLRRRSPPSLRAGPASR